MVCYQQDELLNIQKCETRWGAARDDGSYACLVHVVSCLYIYWYHGNKLWWNRTWECCGDWRWFEYWYPGAEIWWWHVLDVLSFHQFIITTLTRPDHVNLTRYKKWWLHLEMIIFLDYPENSTNNFDILQLKMWCFTWEVWTLNSIEMSVWSNEI